MQIMQIVHVIHGTLTTLRVMRNPHYTDLIEQVTKDTKTGKHNKAKPDADITKSKLKSTGSMSLKEKIERLRNKLDGADVTEMEPVHC